MKRLLITVLAVLTVSVNCYATAVPDDPIAANVKKFVADQTKRAPKIDVVTFKKMIDSKEEMLILDVREPEEVSAGKVIAPNIVYFPRGLVEFYFTKKYNNPNQKIVVICKSGARGAAVVNNLVTLGYKNIVNVDKGILAWIAAGYPLENSFGKYNCAD